MKNKQEDIVVELQSEEIDFFKRVEPQTKRATTAAEVKKTLLVFLSPLKTIFSKETFEAIKYLLGIVFALASPFIVIYFLRILGCIIIFGQFSNDIAIDDIGASNRFEAACAIKALKMENCDSEMKRALDETKDKRHNRLLRGLNESDKKIVLERINDYEKQEEGI
ncbi:hypothetical protein KTE91_03485 [Burkholderia multivorans]|uniref:hypothetical protein n=1 Tax=Burkholderia multivorans TaxID=87883 RepID=UPI001C224AA5|nr:hypothetical protein [Burkholderia multivorans]MBU9434145.1 hypothetical protein [Burkholderia multivorans]